MTKTVAIIAALDTKSAEAGLVKRVIETQGVRSFTIDVGVLGEPGISADYTRAQVATAGNANLSTLIQQHDKSAAMDAMTRGVAVVAQQLFAQSKIDGIIGLGGTSGTVIASSAMRALPVGVPKILISTVASGDTRQYVGTKDIAMLYSVVDIAGINRLSNLILTNAAAAIAGMVQVDTPEIVDRPILAASMFGNTTACIDRARGSLEQQGYEVLVFHATGAGGQTMEALIADGFVDGVLDLTTTEWADELIGGVFAAGPHRLDAAGAKGIPQVIAPGCLDMVNFGAPETIPPQFADRLLYKWNPGVTLMRTTPEENVQLGTILAQKASAATGPVTIMLPIGGISQLDSEGEIFWWPEANQALFDAIRSNSGPNVKILELDCNINDPEFADTASRTLLEMI